MSSQLKAVWIQALSDAPAADIFPGRGWPFAALLVVLEEKGCNFDEVQ
jgi:hypothetical protein